MKNIVISSVCFVCFVMVSIIILDIQQSGVYEREINEGLQHSILNTVKANEKTLLADKSIEQMEANSIRMLVQEIKKGEMEVAFYAIDTAGIIDIQISKEYEHFNQKNETISIRKRGIYERAVEKG